MSIKILLNTLERAKKCVAECNKFDEDVFITQGRYTVDGKSILGVLSLNLMRPVVVEFSTDNYELLDFFKEFQL